MPRQAKPRAPRTRMHVEIDPDLHAILSRELEDPIRPGLIQRGALSTLFNRLIREHLTKKVKPHGNLDHI